MTPTGKRPRPILRAAAALACLAPCGCLSSLKPGDAPRTRFFNAAPPPGVVPAQPVELSEVPALRLRDVGSASYLGERLVWRASDVEYGFRETRRWTEPPAAWLARSLARELFEVRGLRRVELTAFEEVLAPERSARVEVVARLTAPDGVALLQRTIEARVPLSGDDPEEVARATASALGEVVRTVAGEVAGAVAESDGAPGADRG